MRERERERQEGRITNKLLNQLHWCLALSSPVSILIPSTVSNIDSRSMLAEGEHSLFLVLRISFSFVFPLVHQLLAGDAPSPPQGNHTLLRRQDLRGDDTVSWIDQEESDPRD
jgi:hypothetical protein